MITILLFPPFSNIIGKKEIRVDFRKGMKVSDLYQALEWESSNIGSMLSDAHAEEKFLILSKGKVVSSDDELEDGDKVWILSAVGGG